ncbi:hypothetical protein [Actinomycetospora sp. TBRC 11914]|uniref:hypothetical protein n=1 Tax=Actinomycetospora sp. TBRC 11914 TaxID=2729387 RepID=UPI00145F3081|nr:hypothetical protein [Actinomycetospora sp. TBRC 11914]NMO91108.1 hypothetical protein [Actinomycetospora sp. TBRC 11914]
MGRGRTLLLAAALAGAALVGSAPAALAAEPPSPITPDGGGYATLGCAIGSTIEAGMGIPEKYRSCHTIGQLSRRFPQTPDGRMAGDDPNIGPDGQYVGPRE